ncbi:MAG TPA: MFS transporter [Sphingomonas sp.]|nr:MFS transporter [Sphingomonas sp.]
MASVLLAYVDRQALAVLVQPIRASLGLSDTEIGLLQGPAFALVYALAALPLGLAVDRYSRRNLIILGMGVWATSTALCGAADGFWTLFLARAGVGLGEACLIPAVFSLIPDLFPPEKRASAYGIYMATVVPGVSLSLSLAGSVLAWVDQAAAAQPWRVVFLAVSVPAPLLMLGLLLVREPARSADAGVVASASVSPEPIVRLGSFARANWRLLAAVGVGGSMASVAFSTWLQWLPTLLSRAYAMPPARGALAGGLVAALSSVAGGVLAARFSRRLRHEGLLHAEARAAVAPLAFAFIIALAAFGTSSAGTTLGVMALQVVGPVIALTLWPVLIAASTPNRLRGRCTAFMKLTEYLLLSLSAVAVGALSDHVFNEPANFRTAVFLMVASATAVSLLCFRSIPRLLARDPTAIRPVDTAAPPGTRPKAPAIGDHTRKLGA